MSKPPPMTEAWERALARLAASVPLEPADPRLERRLLELARERSRGPRRRRQLLAVLGLSVLSGGALAAAGGLAELRHWWFQVRVGEQAVAVEGQGSGRWRRSFVADDGYRVVVEFERAAPDLGRGHTRIDVREVGRGTVEETSFEQRAATSGTAYLPAARVAGLTPLHRWLDTGGAPCELFLSAEGLQAGSTLWVRETARPEQACVRALGSLPATFGPGGSVLLRERAGGALEVELDDGRGFALALVLRDPAGEGAEGPQGLRTPSGRVDVHWGEVAPQGAADPGVYEASGRDR